MEKKRLSALYVLFSAKEKVTMFHQIVKQVNKSRAGRCTLPLFYSGIRPTVGFIYGWLSRHGPGRWLAVDPPCLHRLFQNTGNGLLKIRIEIRPTAGRISGSGWAFFPMWQKSVFDRLLWVCFP